MPCCAAFENAAGLQFNAKKAADVYLRDGPWRRASACPSGRPKVCAKY